jgi:sialate O-acetylesterase
MKPILLTLLLPYFYSDNMVLQRDAEFIVRGAATPSSVVTVTYDTFKVEAQASEHGTFSIKMPHLPVSATGKPFTFLTSDNQKKIFQNVVVGDVWIAAGQSNMDFPVKSSTECKEVEKEANDPSFRFLHYQFQMPTSPAQWSMEQIERAKTDKAFQGDWEIVAPGNCGKMSTIAVQFGQSLKKQSEGVPIGIIQIAVGGAPSEAFMPEDSLKAMKHGDIYPVWCLQRMKGNLSKANGIGEHPFQPSYIYTRAIEPLSGFGTKGIIWYQGESNATDETNTRPMPDDYMLEVTQTLRNDIARIFGPVPFIMTMLPKMNRPWEPFRKIQEQVAKSCPHTGLIETRDLGDERDVHPRHKTPFATRLAAEAKRMAYDSK